jgi:hypothetical protein
MVYADGMKTYTKVVIPGHNKNAEYYAARKWCTRTFGASNSREAKGSARPWYAKREWVQKLTPSGYGHYHEASFYFRNPADATMFTLVWAKEFRQT